MARADQATQPATVDQEKKPIPIYVRLTGNLPDPDNVSIFRHLCYPFFPTDGRNACSVARRRVFDTEFFVTIFNKDHLGSFQRHIPEKEKSAHVLMLYDLHETKSSIIEEVDEQQKYAQESEYMDSSPCLLLAGLTSADGRQVEGLKDFAQREKIQFIDVKSLNDVYKAFATLVCNVLEKRDPHIRDISL